jgi:hypothetical protein
VRDPRDRTPAWDLLAVLAAKAVVGAAVLRAGFVALSDDDFSRTVIAERFAFAPSFDPSGTSWLPLPFWIAGSAMAAFGRTLFIAREAAVVLGLVSALLVHRAALWAGASRASAALGAVVATTIPTAARLGVSFQPEALAAGLVVLGAAATGRDGFQRLGGAFALGAACLCRYEAWPAAAIFGGLSLVDAARAHAGAPSPSRVGAVRTNIAAALIAGAGPVAWLIHGMRAHGEALFFVHRVAAYRNALGITESWGASVAAYPVLLVLAEPELTLGALALLVLAFFTERTFVSSLIRPALVLASLLSFLVVGRLIDGAPTHHAERTLLPVWSALAIAGIEAAARLVASRRSAAIVLVPAFAVAVGAALRVMRPSETFPERAAERAIGVAARGALSRDARLLVDTADYGYFAVIAAFGAPEHADAFDRHDPREPTAPDAFSTRETLAAKIAASQATALVARREHWPTALTVGRLVATRADFALVNLSPARPELR